MRGAGNGTASFGPFRLSPATREIERDGAPLSLGDRALDILIVLIERAGEVVSHRDLLALVWRGVMVSPGTLRVHITLLRKALGDGESGVRYIENVTGQGYCFVAHIHWEMPAPTARAEFTDVIQPVGANLATERFLNVIGADFADAADRPEQRGRATDSYISNDVELALHCLLFLVAPTGPRIALEIRDLAELQGLPLEHLEHIFNKLQQAEIVGADAGKFSLARAPDQITFLDVVVAVDGRKPLFECRNVRHRCAVFGGKAPLWATKGVCSIHAVMLEAEASMRSALAKRTLVHLASRLAAKTPPTFVDDVSTWLAQRAAANRD